PHRPGRRPQPGSGEAARLPGPAAAVPGGGQAARRVAPRLRFAIIGPSRPGGGSRMAERSPSALDDVRVLDLAGEIGQYCTKLLADLGADVVKIEPPSGDPVRDLPPFYDDEADRQKSLYWLHLNTSKRTVTLDLKQAEARRLF